MEGQCFRNRNSNKHSLLPHLCEEVAALLSPASAPGRGSHSFHTRALEPGCSQTVPTSQCVQGVGVCADVSGALP